MSMLLPHLPALLVVIPLLGAALCPLFNRGSLAWLIATICAWSSFTCVLVIFGVVQEVPFISYAMGGHLPPVGIEYRLDGLNVFVLLLVSFMAAVMLPYAKSSIEREVAAQSQSKYYSIFLLCVAGLLGITATNDIFNIYVFLEISSLATYALIAMGSDRRALFSSYQYLIVGTIGATFILIAIGLLYSVTGTLNITDMANRLPAVADTRPIQAAFAFVTIGIALKAAMFPLHIWLTNAYGYAPSFATAFLASTATKVSIYVFIRLLYNLFGFEYAFRIIPLDFILVLFATSGIFVGSVSAIFQQNVKRSMAFSSVAQMGYIVLGLSLATQPGLVATMLHIANHAFAKGLVFLCIGAVVLRRGGFQLQYFDGVAKQMPLTMMLFVIGGLSLIGVPGTAGFISKWYLVLSFFDRGWWWAAIIVMVSSVLAVVYVWRIVEAAYFRPVPDHAKTNCKEAPNLMLVSMLMLAIANIWFGLDASLTVGAAEAVAGNLYNSTIFSGGLW